MAALVRAATIFEPIDRIRPSHPWTELDDDELALFVGPRRARSHARGVRSRSCRPSSPQSGRRRIGSARERHRRTAAGRPALRSERRHARAASAGKRRSTTKPSRPRSSTRSRTRSASSSGGATDGCSSTSATSRTPKRSSGRRDRCPSCARPEQRSPATDRHRRTPKRRVVADASIGSLVDRLVAATVADRARRARWVRRRARAATKPAASAGCRISRRPASADASPTTWASARRSWSSRSRLHDSATDARRVSDVGDRQLGTRGAAVRTEPPRRSTARKRTVTHSRRPSPSGWTARTIVLTSYGLLRRDRALFNGVEWGRVVLDEAQNVKNPTAQQTRAAWALRTRSRLALTGTPVENRLTDLWSIMQFCNPGLLGPLDEFAERFAGPVERGDDEATDRLRKIVRPFVLRRVKSDPDVAPDLPEKFVSSVVCPADARAGDAVPGDGRRGARTRSRTRRGSRAAARSSR